MKKSNLVWRIWLGYKRHPWWVAARAFFVFSAFWTLIEAFQNFVLSNQALFKGWIYLLIIVAVSVFCSLIFSAAPAKITLHIKNTHTKVEVLFSDLFQVGGCKVIPVNEFFDCDLGDHVSKQSLHGIFIEKIYDGQAARFARDADEGLVGVTCETVNRASGRKKKYPIGTISVVDSSGTRYFLVVNSHTNLETLQAHADLEDFLQCMLRLWDTVRHKANGNVVNVPLLGSGLSKVSLPRQHLLLFLLATLVYGLKGGELGCDVRIVLWDGFVDEIDLSIIKKLGG